MNYVPLEKVLDKADNSIYRLVIMASKRALEIAEGQPVLIEKRTFNKPSLLALEEISVGKIRCKIKT